MELKLNRINADDDAAPRQSRLQQYLLAAGFCPYLNVALILKLFEIKYLKNNF